MQFDLITTLHSPPSGCLNFLQRFSSHQIHLKLREVSTLVLDWIQSLINFNVYFSIKGSVVLGCTYLRLADLDFILHHFTAMLYAVAKCHNQLLHYKLCHYPVSRLLYWHCTFFTLTLQVLCTKIVLFVNLVPKT